MGSIVWYEPKIRHLLRGEGGLVNRYIDKKARQVVRLSKLQVNVDTGALRASIRHKTRGNFAIVTAHDRKAMLIHEGSKPHKIYPSKGKALKFGGSTSVTIVKVVNHPGYKGNKFLTDSLRAVF